MAKLFNLARMTTATTGTGTITLGSAVGGFLSFSSAGVLDQDIVYYAINDGSNSEEGTGVYTASGTTLTRTVNTSTNGNSAINLSGNAQVFVAALAEGLKSRLNAARTFYVDVTNGLDTNGGMASGSGKAWKTLQHAVNWIAANIDVADQSVIIQCADGTYPENLILPNYASSGKGAQATMVIQGNSGAHSNVVIQPSSGNAVTAVDVNSWWALKNLRLNASGGTCITADHSRIAIDGIVFGAANIHKQASNTGAMIEGVNNGYTIAANAACHDSATDGGEIVNQALTVTGTGSMTFSSGFANATNGGIIDYQSTTFSVTTTGSSTRFIRDLTSSISCGSSDPNATIPGTSNGGIAAPSSTVLATMQVALGMAGRSGHGDANVTLTWADMPFTQLTAGLTAARTWTLPPSGGGPGGTRFTIADAGGISGANTLTIQRQGSDTFNGQGVSGNAITLSSAYDSLTVMNDGASGWYLVSKT